MDRTLVYAGSLPLSSDFAYAQRAAMEGIAALTKAILGTSTIVDGLAVTQAASPNMTVVVSSGSLTSLQYVDATAYGPLNADTTNQIVKTAINIGSTTLGPFTAPSTPGQSWNILIQAAFSETDGSSTVLPYYNSSNPAVPYSGPANAGTAQNTRRTQTVTLGSKVGTAATTGTQTTPSPDAGYVALAVVTIANGASSIVNANISVHPNAPLLALTLPNATPAPRRQVFTASGSITPWTVPNGVGRIAVTVIGGGGAGGGCNGTYAGGAGGAGGMSRKTFTVTAGMQVTGTVGAGGTAGTAGNTGGAGGTTSATVNGVTISATGGTGGTGGASTPAGGAGGTGSGGDENYSGGYGSDGGAGGLGGASFMGGGGRNAGGGGSQQNGQAPGSGAGGSYNTSSSGGAGANGLIIIEY